VTGGRPDRLRLAIAHRAAHLEGAVLAAGLADRLGLPRVELERRAQGDGAVLVIARSGDDRHVDASSPVVVISPAAARRDLLRGRCIVCGIEGEGDAPAAAVAAALAEALRLALVLVHAVRRIGEQAPADVPARGHRSTVEARARGRTILDGAATAAGLTDPDDGDRRVLAGRAGPALAAAARAHDAALVTISAAAGPEFVRGVPGSATGYLTRRCDRPLLVCPRDPLVAMDVREALGWTPRIPDHGAERGGR
jgi:hypothetical protein